MPVSSPKDFIESLQKATTARIGIGRAGTRYPTRAQLKFKEDLASARDSVRRDVSKELVRKLGLCPLATRAEDRGAYLMSTSLGRSLNEESVALLKSKTEVWGQKDVALLVSDGLSAEAFEKNVPQMLAPLVDRLRAAQVSVIPPLFIRRARVAVMDHVGEILKPRASIILLGERPGLGISDSLSAYFGYAPGFSRVESDRNVLSNIHARGIPPTEAALMLADALVKVLQLRKSGMSVRFDFT